MATNKRMDYEAIKRLAKETGRPVTDLVALAAQNDPFYQGTPGQREKGEWFAEIYRRQGWDSMRIHLRMCHYQILSLGLMQPGGGRPYENTEQCWDMLNVASKAARYLGLVDMANFDDARNDKPLRYEPDEPDPALAVAAYLFTSELQVPEFPDLPSYRIESYQARQRYHIEVWCEKTTMNRFLEPLCRQYGAVLQTGAGELSLTACQLLIERLRDRGKPARILYISDYDPAGQSMPVAIARKLEYFVRNSELDAEADIRLFPLILTGEQCARYNLPRTPIKESERRKDRFEQRHGEGATELDALEALQPGELARVVRRAMQRYYDPGLDRRAEAARQSLDRALRTLAQTVRGRYSAELGAARAELAGIQADMRPRLEAYSEHVQAVWQAMRADLENAAPYIEDYPLPEAAPGDELGAGLYNSERDYIEQLEAYKRFQGKESRP